MTEIVDVDKSWDGTSDLDQHRQAELAKLTQPGWPPKQKPRNKKQPDHPEVTNGE